MEQSTHHEKLYKFSIGDIGEIHNIKECKKKLNMRRETSFANNTVDI